MDTHVVLTQKIPRVLSVTDHVALSQPSVRITVVIEVARPFIRSLRLSNVILSS